jgi:UDP-N-acetylglucosamine acyltransferase
MSTVIHPTAIIEPGADIGDGCQIGPFCYIGPHVKLGRDNVLHSHAVIDGYTTLGDGNEVFSFACLGKISQDLKYNKAWVSYSRIGSGNVFREYVTVNASSAEGEATVIGDRCLFLSYSHIAHDCILGSHVIISSDAKMAGHVRIDDHAIVNAKTGIIQFARIGKFAFVGGFNKVIKDILPYCIAEGSPSEIRAVNKIGLQRNGYTAAQIKPIDDAFRTIIRSGLSLNDAIAALEEKYPDVADVHEMIAFAASSQLGLARPHKQRGSENA